LPSNAVSRRSPRDGAQRGAKRGGAHRNAGTQAAPGHHYFREFLAEPERRAILEYLSHLHPIWENRYPERQQGLPEGRAQRRLLRPVYWLGGWQFACLDYYRPPRGLKNRVVEAEPYPPALARLVLEIERRVHKLFAPADVPRGFRLNTCLINFYGNRLQDGRSVDVARVGEHRDFEPGPVASLSIGERALFQFVARGTSNGSSGGPHLSQWLDDGSLQIFGGSTYKDRLLHRVQRVGRNAELALPPAIDGFRTRRVNFTFRFVPPEHIVAYRDLAEVARGDVRGYMEELGRHSRFFRAALDAAG
jgi:alkylated DNA repair protein (DNA oxidative demethylase)